MPDLIPALAGGRAPSRASGPRQVATDSATLARRSVRLAMRRPDAMLTALLMPVMLMLLFGYLFGGAIGVTIPGRFAVAGLVDAHAHPTVASDADWPYLADRAHGEARLAEYAASGVTVARGAGGRSEVTIGFAQTPTEGRPVVTAAGRFLAPPGRYFPRMHTPVPADELVAAVTAEVSAGATWVKIIGDFPEWGADGPVPNSTTATYDPAVLRQAIDAAHAAGARVAVHSNLADSGLTALGADSIEHGTGLDRDEIEALGARGGAWTPTLCAVLQDPGSADPERRKRTEERRERLRDALPYAVAQAIAAAGSSARDYLGIHPVGDIVTYDRDPREDPAVLSRPAAVVVRGTRIR